MAKETFVLYSNLYEKTKSLSDDEFGKIIRKILLYVRGEEKLPKLEDKLETVFDFIKYDLDENQKKYEKRCEQNRLNGSKGGAPRGNKNASKQSKTTETTEISKTTENNMTHHNHIHNHKDINNRVNRVKGEEEEKEEGKKEPEKISYADYVKMSKDEYLKLINNYGEEFTKECINKLDNYKGSKGKTYKSDYRAILSWVVNEVKKYLKPEKKNPEWFNKKYDSEPMEEEEKEEIEKILKEIGE